jgi:protein-S-isoprenylcysteine O-methyltransferase Ste14
MADTGSHQVVTRWQRWWSGCGLRRHRFLLTVVGLACIAFGIVVAVLVPDSGPAWAMSVAGCLAAGVLLLTRVVIGSFRPRRGVGL